MIEPSSSNIESPVLYSCIQKFKIVLLMVSFFSMCWYLVIIQSPKLNVLSVCMAHDQWRNEAKCQPPASICCPHWALVNSRFINVLSLFFARHFFCPPTSLAEFFCSAKLYFFCRSTLVKSDINLPILFRNLQNAVTTLTTLTIVLIVSSLSYPSDSLQMMNKLCLISKPVVQLCDIWLSSTSFLLVINYHLFSL